MVHWNLFLDLSPRPCFPLPLPLCLLSLSPATVSALYSTHAQPLPAPSENPSVLWNSPPTATTSCCLDPTLFLFSISLNPLTSVVLLHPLQGGKSQNHCIWPGCSRINSSWGTKGSYCKIKHPQQLQQYINNILRLKCSFFPGKEHPCYCPAFKLFCLCEAGERHLAKPSPGGAWSYCWGLGKASAEGRSCHMPNPQL